jgi:tetratricopeptide (TPR) repeat protein
MKRIILTLIASALFILSFAQEGLTEAQIAKNAGNEAFRNDQFVEAIASYETYLNSDEETVESDVNTQQLYVRAHRLAADAFLKNKDYTKAQQYYNKYMEIGGDDAKQDGGIAYNLAVCAMKMDKNDEAINQFQRAVDLNSRPDMSMLYMANIYRKAGNDQKMISTLKTALEKYPQSRYRSKMISMLVKPMLQEASVPFNEANELAKKAQGSPTEYVAYMSQASTKFEEAIPYFEKVLEYDPRNEVAQTYINACRDNIKAFNDYKDSLDN